MEKPQKTKKKSQKRIDFNNVLINAIRALQALDRLFDPETLDAIKSWIDQLLDA